MILFVGHDTVKYSTESCGERTRQQRDRERERECVCVLLQIGCGIGNKFGR
jgi:hypothetical protein